MEALSRHVNAMQRLIIIIFKSSVPQNEECFASKYLSENKFLAALILHESKDSGGSIILFSLTSY